VEEVTAGFQESGTPHQEMKWAELFDLFASEYGWTVEETLSHTFKQLKYLLEAMPKRQMRQLEWEAKLHGAKLKRPIASRTYDVVKQFDEVKQKGFPVEDK